MDIVRRSDKASASLLQRRLRIGYARAAASWQMEDRGIVGPADAAGSGGLVTATDGAATWGREDDEA